MTILNLIGFIIIICLKEFVLVIQFTIISGRVTSAVGKVKSQLFGKNILNVFNLNLRGHMPSREYKLLKTVFFCKIFIKNN